MLLSVTKFEGCCAHQILLFEPIMNLLSPVHIFALYDP
jgi:hypothetical protein